MYANNEIGTIEPIQEIAKEIRHFNKKENKKVLFHTDACQAMNYLFTENIEKLGVDLMTFNGSKIYGPKGTGVLYKKRGVQLNPLYLGGGQEFGLRSGTENVALVAGLSLALEKVSKIKERESARLTLLRDYAIQKILACPEELEGLNLKVPPFKIILNGDAKERLPNNINISVSGISSELLVVELDALGIRISEKSACHSESEGISHVIKAIGKNSGSLRISLGQQTTKKDIDYLVSSLTKILEKYKKFK
jgi:cysteine desulfurase